MIDTNNLDTISAKIEAVIDKKFSKLNIATSSSNISSAHEKHFACGTCGGTNHDTSYCGGTHSEHVVEVGYGAYNPKALVMSYDGYGYNQEHVTVVNYGGEGQGAGYVQPSIISQSYRSPFNSNPNQGHFNLGYN